MSEEKPSNQSDLPQVYKEEDLALMIELIQNGLWSNKNLVTALHIAESTVIEWKKRPEVQDAHRKAILKYSKKRMDTENILKELDVDIKSQPSTLVQINYTPIFGGKSVDAIPASTGDAQDIQPEKED